MFVEGCIDLVACPWWGKIEWLKSFKHLRGDGLGPLIHPWSVYLMVHMFHTLYVVYVHGGCSDLVGYPWWGKCNG